MEKTLGKLEKDDEIYKLADGFDLDSSVPPFVKEYKFTTGEARKRVKRMEEDIE